jgi:hypothetical protein
MTGPSPDNGRTGDGRYTVHEAALLLGLSVEAVRKRAERGKLGSIKGEDGTRYILLDSDQTKTGLGPDNDQTELIEALYGQIEFLREELAARNVELRHREEEYREESRRKDHLLAAALERIPAIEEAPAEPRESDVTASAERAAADIPSESQGQEVPVSWWRRLFSG